MSELQIIDQRDVLGKDFKIYGDFGNPLFLAKDVAEWIENLNVSQMLNVVDESEKVICNVYTLGGNQESWFVTEDGLMEILFQSRKPIAKEFKKQVKEILRTIRKTGTYSAKPLSQLEILAQSAQILLEQDKAIKQISVMQMAQANELQGMRDVITLSTISWREDTKNLIVKITHKAGDILSISDIWKDAYKLLDARMGVNVKQRLTNLRNRLMNEGVCKSKRDKANQLDVIGEDKKLIEGFVAIVKEMAIKAGVA